MQLNKTDRNDAEGLAQIMHTGWYRAVHMRLMHTAPAHSWVLAFNWPERGHDRVPMGRKRNKGKSAAAAISAPKEHSIIPCPFRKSYPNI